MKTIPLYPDYMITENGEVYRVVFRNRTCAKDIKPRLLKEWIAENGYMRVGLTQNNKTICKFVHRLLLETYRGSCPEGHEASHLDGVRTNNTLSNLAWATRKQNHAMKKIHGTAQWGENNHFTKLDSIKVLEIRQALSGGAKLSELAPLYGVCESTISYIRLRKTWRHI